MRMAVRKAVSDLSGVKPGESVPKVNVTAVVEIPEYDFLKYEYDGKRFVVDRVLPSGMVYPLNYGFVLGSDLQEDGDRLDCYIVAPCPLTTGTVVRGYIAGALEVIDEGQQDWKFLVVCNGRWPVEEKYHEVMEEFAHAFPPRGEGDWEPDAQLEILWLLKQFTERLMEAEGQKGAVVGVYSEKFASDLYRARVWAKKELEKTIEAYEDHFTDL